MSRPCAWCAQTAYLAGEHLVVAVIVGEAGEERAVRAERESRIRAPVVHEAAHPLAGQVLGVGRAAAVAARQQFVAVLERVCEPRGDLGDGRQVFLQSREGVPASVQCGAQRGVRIVSHR